MYYFKLTQSTCILNTGILIAWFRNNFGSIEKDKLDICCLIIGKN